MNRGLPPARTPAACSTLLDDLAPADTRVGRPPLRAATAFAVDGARPLYWQTAQSPHEPVGLVKSAPHVYELHQSLRLGIFARTGAQQARSFNSPIRSGLSVVEMDDIVENHGQSPFRIRDTILRMQKNKDARAPRPRQWKCSTLPTALR